jgi:hypothetical protein
MAGFKEFMKLYNPKLTLGISINGIILLRRTSPDCSKDNPHRVGVENPSDRWGQLVVGL